MAFAMPIPLLAIAVGLAIFLALNSSALLVVYLPTTKHRKLSSAESVLSTILLRIVIFSLGAIALCGLSLWLKTQFSVDPTESLDDVQRWIRQI